MDSQITTIILAVLAGGLGTGFTVPFFNYLASQRRETLKGQSENKEQNSVGVQVYITTLERRIDKQDARIDTLIEEYQKRIEAKDEQIEELILQHSRELRVKDEILERLRDELREVRHAVNDLQQVNKTADELKNL
jgi:chromosome segregation ATPase